jgi:hypothetical protein
VVNASLKITPNTTCSDINKIADDFRKEITADVNGIAGEVSRNFQQFRESPK